MTILETQLIFQGPVFHGTTMIMGGREMGIWGGKVSDHITWNLAIIKSQESAISKRRNHLGIGIKIVSHHKVGPS